MPINTDPPYDRLETILMGGTVDPPYSRKELIAMQAGGGSGGGSGSGALIVNSNGESANNVGEYDVGETLDATFAEIYEALKAGTPVYIRRVVENNGPSSDYNCASALFSVLSAFKYSTAYRIFALSLTGWLYGSKDYLGQPAVVTFSANSPSSYPSAIVNAKNSNVIDDWD